MMCCGGFPYPRSSSAFAADTLAAGAALGLAIIDTSVSIASPVCARASSFTSAITLGRQEFVSASRPEVIDSYSAAYKSKKIPIYGKEENYPPVLMKIL